MAPPRRAAPLTAVLVAAMLAVQIGPAAGELAFTASFENATLEPFVQSSNAKYAGQSVTAADGGLRLDDANKHYGVAAPLAAPFKTEDGSVSIQYEVTLTDGLSCGGAYIKLLEASAGLDVATFDDKTPYAIMFGPDKCGATNKVHFIVRQQNPVTQEWSEHHLTGGPRAFTDKKAHLYAAVVDGATQGLEIVIDGESKFKGTLWDALDPPLTPPEEIDDPKDSKPADWVDEEKIDDPAASKPDDWDEDAPRKITDPAATKPAGWLDDAPTMIPDPEAARPEDWDDDEDGAWEAPEVPNPACAAAPGCGAWVAPEIDNPAYKGKWTPPKIDNPAYKGPWAPRKIKNAAYFVPENPAKSLPAIGAVAVEVWTTNKGIVYDNFALGATADDGKPLATAFYDRKAEEFAKEEEKKAKKKLKKLEQRLAEGSIFAKGQKFILDLIYTAEQQPAEAAMSVGVLLVTIIVLVVFRKKKKTPKADDKPAEGGADADAAAPAAAAAEDEDQDSKEEKREKPPKAE